MSDKSFDLNSRRTVYRFPIIRPLMPEPSRWLQYLDASYKAKWYSNFGPLVRQLESELTGAFCHPGERIASTASGTSGIAAALIALGVRGNVLIPAFTFPATVSAVVMAGAHPCVLDVDPETWALSAPLLEQALQSQEYGAVVLVVPFGIARDFQVHFDICSRYGVPVVIDNASGFGIRTLSLPGERCMEVYSLHATKPFAIGEGGAIRSHASHEEALRRALNFGLLSGGALAGSWGINGKMPEISAAVGLAVLREFEEVLARRMATAARYGELVRNYECLRYRSDIDRSPWQAFPVLFPTPAMAEAFIRNSAASGLEIRIAYSPSLEDWPGTTKIAPCPNARSLAERVACLPIYSDITEQEIAGILAIAREALEASCVD
jgi:dTDP-4-amino-4,6-dideoxygalactose transaminase